MTRPISFALGNIWRWTDSKNKADLLDYARKLKIDGVEITFGPTEDLDNFRLSKKDSRWLRSLEYVTIHAPFRYEKKPIEECLDKILELYQETDAKKVIIHPHQLPKKEVLKKYKINVITENMRPCKSIDISNLQEIASDYKIGICLDVSHAYFWSKYETEKLANAFEKNVEQIHLSATYRKKDHRSMQIASKDFMKSIEPIKKLDCPLVIEEDIEKKNLRHLHQEVNYIRNLFS